MSQNTKKETTTDVAFEKAIRNENRTVRTQEIEKTNPSWDMVEECLWNMFEDEDEFVVLTADNVQDNVQFVQAAQIADGIIVQLGIGEDGDHTKLVEMAFTEEECRDIFYEFYHSSHVRDIAAYEPVKFL